MDLFDLFVKAGQNDPTLRKLEILEHNLSTSALFSFSNVMLTNTKIRFLNIKTGWLTDVGIVSLCNMLRQNESINHVIINSIYIDHISDISGFAISQVIKMNKTIIDMNLSLNISSSGAGFIADALMWNTTLQKLDLSDNAIDDNGMTKLSNVLMYHSSITYLDLFNNLFLNGGLKGLASMVENNKKLITLGFGKDLDYYTDNYSNKSMQIFAQSIRKNTTLQNLFINQFSDYEFKHETYLEFAKSISLNNSLKIFVLSGFIPAENDIPDDIFKLIGMNKSIINYGLDGICSDDESMMIKIFPKVYSIEQRNKKYNRIFGKTLAEICFENLKSNK